MFDAASVTLAVHVLRAGKYYPGTTLVVLRPAKDFRLVSVNFSQEKRDSEVRRATSTGRQVWCRLNLFGDSLSHENGVRVRSLKSDPDISVPAIKLTN